MQLRGLYAKPLQYAAIYGFWFDNTEHLRNSEHVKNTGLLLHSLNLVIAPWLVFN